MLTELQDERVGNAFKVGRQLAAKFRNGEVATGGSPGVQVGRGWGKGRARNVRLKKTSVLVHAKNSVLKGEKSCSQRFSISA